MKNPFLEHNSVENQIKTGFYYDTNLKQITFIYEKEDADFWESRYNVYGRLNFQGSFDSMIKLEDAQDMVENLDLDYDWIDSNDEVHNAFYKFLKENEMFSLLSQLKEIYEYYNDINELQENYDNVSETTDFEIDDLVEAKGDDYTYTNKYSEFVGQVIYINPETKLITLKTIFHNQSDCIRLIFPDINPDFMQKLIKNTNLKKYNAYEELT